jgi:hypothetical protein
MKLKVLVLVVLLLGFYVRAEEPVVLEQVSNLVAATATVKDGYVLLNSILTLFENLNTSGTPGAGGITVVEERLSQLSKEARTARETNLIDNIFYNRYRRMLMILKMVITPVVKTDLLENPFTKALTDFVWDVTYEHWSWNDNDGIVKMSAALEEELVQLQFYLDTRQAREEFKKKMGKLLPPPAKKKSETK